MVRSLPEHLAGIAPVKGVGVEGSHVMEPVVRVPGKHALRGGGECRVGLGLQVVRRFRRQRRKKVWSWGLRGCSISRNILESSDFVRRNVQSWDSPDLVASHFKKVSATEEKA